jgi:hypothetical protein
MNAIVSLNLRDYMHAETRASFEAAASRWKCDLVELSQPLLAPGATKVHVYWQKTLIPLHDPIRTKYSRIAVLDADTLIRDDCPSLFEVVPEGRFGVAARHQPGHPASRVGHLSFWARKHAWPCPSAAQYINSGVVVCEPETHERFLRACLDAAASVKYTTTYGGDQEVLSSVLHGMKAPTTWLPWQFNALRPGYGNSLANLGDMQAYIYHFCGRGKWGYRRLVVKCRWRIST